MRLNKVEYSSIKKTIHALDPEAKIYLFGSRADDNKKGGDIDLLIISGRLGYPDKREIRIRLHELIGEQKIDLVITEDLSKPFVQLALKEGVLL